MLSLRNPDLLNESPSAKQSYRRLHIANRVVMVLMVVLVILAIWNIIALISVLRGATTELIDMASIREHLSSRLLWVTALLTLGVFIFKEWRWGERNFSIVFFLCGLLFLSLIPVMSAEVEPAEEQVTVELTYAQCQPGGIDGSVLADADKCEVIAAEEGDVFLSPANPETTDVEWMPPARREVGYSRWNVDARGKFRAYFIVKQPSLEYCESSQVATSSNPVEQIGHSCFERDGSAWLVAPIDTSKVNSGFLTVYQQAEP